jgi:hypothetical protein
MELQDLLERMASISPGVRAHITGHLWKENIEEDELTKETLVNECFAVMINEAYEIGLEFYCPLGELCESWTTIDHTLLLFELVFPTPLYRSIVEDDSFNRLISSVIMDSMSLAGESAVMTMLEYLALMNEDTAPVFAEPYAFLLDKLKSTPVFDQYVRGILEIQNTPVAVPVDEEMIQEYLEAVQHTFASLLQATDVIAQKLTDDNLDAVYNSVNEYKLVATNPVTLDIYTWMHDTAKQQEQLPLAQALVVKYTTQFQTSVPFYLEYYVARGEAFSRCDIVNLILGAYISTTTKDAFAARVTDVFKRMQDSGYMATPDIYALFQEVTLVLVQEYY